MMKTISVNRKALRDYEILERVEAGLVLTGTEIKSIRSGRVNLQAAFARVDKGEVWLHNAHIAEYKEGGIYNHDPIRPRKLLLSRQEIDRLSRVAAQKGLTLVPLSLYIKKHWAKAEIGLARGRRRYEKRQVILKRDAEREMQRTIRRRQ
jgi:SsrA-binding protein